MEQDNKEREQQRRCYATSINTSSGVELIK